MGYIRMVDTGERIEGAEQVKAFLAQHGLLFDRWSIDRVTGELKTEYALSDEQKAAIIDAFQPELDDLKARQGYQTEDIVVLSEKTPNLPQLLDMFKKEHHHTDDEVRFVVDGHGVFTIKGKDGRYFDTVVEEGDLIVVPAYTRHWFTLAEDNKIKCIRIFKTPEGWVAIYDERQAAASQTA